MIVDRLKNLDNLTTQEEAVVDYILKNPRSLLKMSINDLALASYTSASTVVRLCKKAGTKGYVDFKMVYISEYPELMRLNESLKQVPFDKTSNIDDVIHTLPLIFNKTIDYTKSMIDRATIVRVVNQIKGCKYLNIYGDGINFDVANIAAYKFEEVGINAKAYSSTHWQHIARLGMNHIPAFAILLSHTGKNPNILDAAKRLKEHNIPTLAICGKSDRRLSSLCTETLQIMTSTSTLEMSNTLFTLSTLYVFEVLVMAMYIQNFESVEQVAKKLFGSRDTWNLEE
ncbi:MAG: hypothetical protein A2Y20_01555 [Firmicutes bacterium GWF2_51_9]|nr:MAG: hypothetical protein A2Y20_01555 [Firmicutes bacterium GWF2_51_9]OGS58586.1 MAG: hypothetical protein A2Y19_07825 [Firmicutes bacterium GWE2_51_13]HAM62467.1 MurR/RpiR family transcriptional regulator [Erysipelotrichaceae bacterium]HAO61314.1 MurR/RpiR family transcriptional regulator [Erysipelotrichaceae bacterium]HBZ41871.1 MurR/RpiR family transcriptional regulator [Erysipelotrichaceae bacterium]